MSFFLLFALCPQAQNQREHKRVDCQPDMVAEVLNHGYGVRCGYVTLPQDYDEPAAGALQIHYSFIESRSRNPQPDPLVYLVGGPGSSGSALLPISFRNYLHVFAGERDIIVIDQRGTGLSMPSLECEEAERRQNEILQSRHHEHAELLLDILSDCQARLAQQGLRFASFHSGNSARDIYEVLRTLGYAEWNLVGVSYGSRLALTMMRDFPGSLRSVMLDSVYPPQADIYIDSYFHGERALTVLFEACAASESCSRRYPDLAAVFYRLYERLNKEPLMAKTVGRGQQALQIEISGYRMYDWVFNWLYELPAIQLIPQMVFSLAAGLGELPAQFGILFERSMTRLSLGMHYTVQCQEEFGGADARDYGILLKAHPHLSGYLSYPVEGTATLSRLCAIWQAQARPAAIANAAVSSDIPALLLSGNFDPITPPGYADLAAASLSRAYTYVLPHVGHGVLRSDECALRIAQAFIRQPLREPDSSCIAATRPIAFS